MRVLVTVTPMVNYPGAVPTEPVSRALAHHLRRQDIAVRVLSESRPPGEWPSGVEFVAGDITRPADTPEAFAGVDRLFLAGATPATAHQAMEQARAAGVVKVVDLSSHGPDFEVALPPEYWHWLAVEVVVERSGMAWGHVVPSATMGATLTGVYPLAGDVWRERIARRRPIRSPYATARVPLIHEDDLAEVVTRVLLETSFDGRRTEAAGRPVSALERAEALRDATGSPITVEDVAADHAPAVLRSMGLEDHDIAHLLSTLQWFAEHDDDTYLATERILGRPLRDFSTWARQNAAAFA